MAATTRDGTHLTTHAVRVRGSADAAYRLLADVSLWPQHFQPTVFAERVEGDDTDERIRIWAFANGEVRTWTSRRRLDPVARSVEFRQEVSQPLDVAERSVPFVQMEHRRLQAKRAHGARAADAEDHLLTNAGRLVAAIEAIRDVTICGRVVLAVRVEQINRHSADAGLP